MTTLAAVPATTRFRAEIAKARLLGFRAQVRVDETGPLPIAYVRLAALTPKARAACREHGGTTSTGVEARQEFYGPTSLADAIDAAFLAALQMAKDALA